MNSEKINHIETLLNLLVALIQQQTKQNITFGIVTQKELLALLDISPNTLKTWEKNGLPRLEPPIEGTRTVYYKLSDVLNFLEN
ncbi:helix-turn-helix domain-containing protein [Streptococcus suis]|uniref:Helix-turn-helix domain-containing protein n=1 Tax=Streptococcus suis TaxID=1307 RepID=A0A4T2GX30_STRSU|nr:MerR family transcriptional regulator [Streptococcus suis]MBS8071308.1 helix-turn-helix domain-containing protein [Streptococcus suis]MBS8094346.1 helix-turn-helix domain-containing protein [Streptococcus suis]MBS8103727.1 helix-turn-helix domain-containing protein [Streptococcus suis]MBY4965540.1 helix-turn-helix domain-containing protein [Streptococcus suis]MBY4976489.1 helix-turn-helix domain-containing protein [Streptococcus suis]